MNLGFDMDRILAAASEANIDHPQQFVKSFLNSLKYNPTNIGDSDSSNEISDDLLNDYEQSFDFSTPNRVHVSSCDPPTPTLSLPDSFGGEFSRCVETDHRRIGGCPRCSQYPLSYAEMIGKYQHSMREQASAHDADMQRLKKVHASSEDNHRMEVRALEERVQRLSAQVDSETLLRRQSDERAAKYDTTHTALQTTTAQLEELRATVEHQRLSITALTASEQSARRASEEAVGLRDLLALDKSFLQQEVKSLEARLDERTRAAEASSSKVQSLELRVSQMTDQLLSLQLTARGDLDHRLEKELLRLREDGARELESMKAAARDIVDRENRVLLEAKQSLEAECVQLRRRNDALSADLTALRQEMHASSGEKSDELSGVRAELRVKSFELATLGVSVEERMKQIRQMELQLETQRQQVDAHRQALLKLEAESAASISVLRADLDRACTRLRAYEVLEEEVDQAVVRAAGLGLREESEEGARTSGGNESAEVDAGTKRLLQSVRSIPCDPERRVRQAVYLAQRLLETERQRDKAVAEAAELLAELATAHEKCALAEETLARGTQPAQYLAGKLRAEERLRRESAAQCVRLEGELRRRKTAQAEAVEDARQLRERLFHLLEQRGELETVRAMVRQLCEVSSAGGAHLPQLADFRPTQRRGHEDGDDSDDDSVSSGSSYSGSEGGGAGLGERRRGVRTPNAQAPQPSQLKDTPSRSPSGVAKGSATAASPTELRPFGLSPEQLERITSPPSERRADQQRRTSELGGDCLAGDELTARLVVSE